MKLFNWKQIWIIGKIDLKVKCCFRFIKEEKIQDEEISNLQAKKMKEKRIQILMLENKLKDLEKEKEINNKNKSQLDLLKSEETKA